MAKTGRKLLDIPGDKVEALASYGCTNTEIASFFGCNSDTIRKRFSENLTKGRDSGKIRLRQKQFEVAMKGNVSMLIWLGKNILDQKDQQSIEHSGSIDSNLSMIDLRKSLDEFENEQEAERSAEAEGTKSEDK